MTHISRSTPTIGIPVYNDVGYLPLLLSTIRMYTTGDYHLVVVDDGSSDMDRVNSTRNACKDFGADLITHDKNYGIRVWNTICQQGLAMGSEVIVLCSNDVLVPPHWLDAALVALCENPDHPIGNVFWQTLDLPQKNTLEQARLMHTELADIEYRFLHHGLNRCANRFYAREDIDLGRPTKNIMPLGVVFALTAETYQAIGPFPEDYACFGESDFGLRCSRLGLCSLGLPYPLVYHAVGKTFRDPSTWEALHLAERCDQSGLLFRERWLRPEHMDSPELSFWPYIEQEFRPLLRKLGATKLLDRRSLSDTDTLCINGEDKRVPGVGIKEFDLP